jgi:hypothetical protein
MTGAAALGDTSFVGSLDVRIADAPLSLASVGLQMRATARAAALVGMQ